MGKGQSKAAPVATTWDQNVTSSLRDLFGITATGGVFLTGVDAITLPMAFAAGSVIGAGVGVCRGDWDISRPARGFGTLMVGLSLAVPPYVRMVYAPWLFISPSACAWAAFTGGIVGVGVHLVRAVPLSGERAAAAAAAADAAIVPPPDAEPPALANELPPGVRACLGSAMIGAGLYLAAPGALRVAFMYGGS